MVDDILKKHPLHRHLYFLILIFICEFWKSKFKFVVSSQQNSQWPIQYGGRYIKKSTHYTDIYISWFLFVNFENLSLNSLSAVSKTPGNNCLNYRIDIEIRTSKRMGWRVNEFSLLWSPISQKLIVTWTWKFVMIDVSS